MFAAVSSKRVKEVKEPIELGIWPLIFPPTVNGIRESPSTRFCAVHETPAQRQAFVVGVVPL